MNGLYKAELVHRRGPWRGLEDLELATLEWVDWFNRTAGSAAPSATRGSGGSVFYNMNKSNFSSLEILDTEKKVVGNFESEVSPFHEAILFNEHQNRYLSRLRDALLPRLVSGHLQVNTA